MNTEDNKAILGFPYKGKAYLKSFLVNLMFSLIFAALMAISANSFFYLPFTPVPVTMQVFTVLISSIILGSRWAFISQAWYILMGILGLPVFAGFKSGAAALAGPTGGYIIGFLVSSFVCGYIYEHFQILTLRITLRAKKLIKIVRQNSLSDFSSYELDKENNTPVKNNTFACFISCIAGVSTIYLLGYFHLLGYLSMTTPKVEFLTLMLKTWELGIKPFILIDLLKILAILGILRAQKKIIKSKKF